MQLSMSIILLSVLLPSSIYCAPTGTPEVPAAHSPAVGGATSVRVRKCPGGKGEHAGYIVTLKKGFNVEGSDAMKLIPPGVEVAQLKIINGFHADLDMAILTKMMELPDVDTISENCRHGPQ